MAQKRTVQDIYALITPNTSEDEFEAGDEVQIQHRVERLEDFGWIDGWEESDIAYTAELTELGAAIINYANHTRNEGTFGQEIERSVGSFVNRARANFLEEDTWNLVEVRDEEVVLENQLGDQQVYELVASSTAPGAQEGEQPRDEEGHFEEKEKQEEQEEEEEAAEA